MSEDRSEIRSFFEGKDVFVTGATGFLGKLLVEKLLRACLVNKIYILIRPKKGKSEEERYKEIFEVPLFEPLRKQQPDFQTRVSMITGDCVQPMLGISEEDRSKLISNVSVILHCAATVRFDQKLRTAAYINIRATKDLLAMSREMKNLKAFVHVSTAYSNCTRTDIDEVFYEPRMSPDKLLKLLEDYDDEFIEGFTPSLLGKSPNTYAFTKSISENVIKSESHGLPVTLVRPSIVISTYKDPLKGWIDNFYGAVGVSHGAALGLLRTLHAIPENKADLVPADYVINIMLSAAWDVAQKFEEKLEVIKDEVNEVPIYNFVATPENPIDWKTYMKLVEVHGKKIPSPLIIWHFFFTLNRYKWKHDLEIFLYHWIPAYFVDFVAVCLRRKPIMVEGYEKIHKFCDVIAYFSTNEWNFTNTNTQALWKKLNSRDKEIFEFSMKEFSWEDYFPGFVEGGRVYLLKDPLDTVPAGRRKFLIVKCLHYTILGFLIFGLFFFTFMVLNRII